METSTVLIGVAIVVVLVIAVIAMVYVIRKQDKCPQVPSAIDFWTTPDKSKGSTVISCPAGTNISVQAADYGAPWLRCDWVDVTAQAGNILNGKNSYEIPAGTVMGPMLGVTSSCAGGERTFAGAYACLTSA